MVREIVCIGLPAGPRILTATPKPAYAQLPCSFSVFLHPTPIVVDVVVLIMSRELGAQLLPDLSGRLGQVRSEPVFEISKLRSQFLRRRFPLQFELACAARAAVMRKAKEVERARCPLTTPLGIAGGKAAKPKQFRLVLG